MKKSGILFHALLILLVANDALAQVSVVFPSNNTRFRESDQHFLTWQSEPFATDDNRYDYKVFIFEADRGTSKEVATSTEVFSTFELEDDGFANQKTIVIGVSTAEELNENKEYFWFVQSLQDGDVISSSDTANFYGPWFAEYFYAQNTRVDFDTLLNFNTDSLAGVVTVEFAGQPTSVEFSGLSMDNSGGFYVLTSGSLEHFPDTTALIQLPVVDDNPVDDLVFARESFRLNRNGNSESGTMTIYESPSGETLEIEDISLRTTDGFEGYLAELLPVEDSIIFGGSTEMRIDEMTLLNSSGTYRVVLQGQITLPSDMELFEETAIPFELSAGEGRLDSFSGTLENTVVENIGIPLLFSANDFTVDEVNGVTLSVELTANLGTEQNGVLFETGNFPELTFDLNFGTNSVSSEYTLTSDLNGTWLNYTTNFRGITINDNPVAFTGLFQGFTSIPLIESSEVELIGAFDSEGSDKPQITSFSSDGELYGYDISISNVAFEDAEDISNAIIVVDGTILIEYISEAPIPFQYKYDNMGPLSTTVSVDGEELPFTPPYIRSITDITDRSATISFDEVDNASAYFASVFEIGSSEPLSNLNRVSVEAPALITGLPDSTELTIIIGVVLSDQTELQSLPISITTRELVLGSLLDTSVEVYPNPVSNVLKVNFSGKDLVNPRIFNTFGAEVNVPFSKGLSQYTFDTSSLPSGLYVVRFSNTSNKASFSFIKN